MKKKEKESQRRISNVKKNLGKDQETMEKYFKKNEKEALVTENQNQEMLPAKFSGFDIDINSASNSVIGLQSLIIIIMMMMMMMIMMMLMIMIT